MNVRWRCGWLAVVVLLGCEAFDNERFDQVKDDILSNQGGGQMDAGMDAGQDAGTDAGPDAGDRDAAVFDPTTCSQGKCWWSGQTEEGCTTAGRPTLDDRPSGTSDEELPPIYLALSQIRLGAFLADGTADEEAWTKFGLDLDGVCTNSIGCDDVPMGTVSCKAVSPQVPFDGDECRDNTFARLQPVAAMVPQIGEIFGLSEDVFNCALYNGDYSVFTKVSGYNGELDDAEVRVDLYTSVGLENDTAWACPEEDFADNYPLWLPSEPWLIDEDALTAPIENEGELPPSKTATTDAYVRGGYLVAMLPPDTSVRMAGDNALFPGFNLVLQGGMLIGRLQQTRASTWIARDGLVTGSVRQQDLLDAFRQIGLCPGSELEEFYTAVDTYVTENADVLADGTVDPDTECDAMSVGIAFQADQAMPGKATAISELVDCPPPPVVTPPAAGTDGGT